jgi:hypothetical protein
LRQDFLRERAEGRDKEGEKRRGEEKRGEEVREGRRNNGKSRADYVPSR